MKNRQKICILLVFVFLAATVLSSCTMQSTETAAVASNADENIIDEENMLSIVEELSSEKYKGRLVGTKENEMAAQYISNQFKQIGLENPEGLENYIQDFETPVILIEEEPIMQLEDKSGNVVKSFTYTENFLFRTLSSSSSIDIKAPLYTVDSIEAAATASEAVENKIALFPLSISRNITVPNVISYCKKTGASAGIIEFDTKSSRRNYSNLTVTPIRADLNVGPYDPYLIVDNDTFSEITDAVSKDLFLHIKCDFSREFNKQVPNVIGMIPGSDPKLKDEYIIVGAHFDHVGDNKNGTYNPGALDNASGTAGLIEIARIIKNSKIPPRKSIIFAAFNSEEARLAGSQYFVRNPIYPLSKSVMINMDMIGCSADIPLTIATANNHKNTLQNELSKYAEEMKMNYKVNIIDGSDHFSFTQMGVESVLLINEDFLNGYHSPDDTIEDVDKLKMEQAVKLVLRYIDNNAY